MSRAIFVGPRVICLAALATGLGCSSSPSETSSTPATNSSASSSVSFKTDLMPILTASCAQGPGAICHGDPSDTDAGATGGLPRLYLGPPPPTGTTDPTVIATIYQGLLGKSTEDTSLDVVDPGNPGQSYLIDKLTNNLSSLTCSNPALMPQPCGYQMPELETALSASQIQMFENWITQGAPNN